MPDGISTSSAATRLRTTGVTVRAMLESGRLSGAKRSRGTRFVWEVDAASVERYLRQHGPYEGRQRGTRATIERLDHEMKALRSLAEASSFEGLVRLHEERDDLRARNVALIDALARARTVADLQAQADEQRAAVVQHLLAASGAAERADELRRAVVAELQEATAAFTRAGHAGQLSAEDDAS